MNSTCSIFSGVVLPAARGVHCTSVSAVYTVRPCQHAEASNHLSITVTLHMLGWRRKGDSDSDDDPARLLDSARAVLPQMSTDGTRTSAQMVDGNSGFDSEKISGVFIFPTQ